MSVERSTGEMLLGPPKSKAGRHIVGIPDAIIPALREHLSVFVKDDPGALVFPGAKGGRLRRGNFNKCVWPGGQPRSDEMPSLSSTNSVGLPVTICAFPKQLYLELVEVAPVLPVRLR